MAARTGASVGVAVTITILGLLSVALFVTTMVFYGNAQRARQDLNQARDDYARFVSDAQREHASVRAVVTAAERQNRSVVEHLMLTRAELLNLLTGDQQAPIDAVRQRVATIDGADTMPLFDLIGQRVGRIAQLEERVRVAEADRRAAQAEAEAEARRIAQIEAAFNTRGSQLQGNVSDIMSQLNLTRDRFGEIENRYARDVEQLESRFSGQVSDLQTRVDQLTQENMVLQDQLIRARAAGAGDRVMPRDEAALVDGRIDAVDRAANEVVLSIGRRDKVVLGMTFAVYSSPTDIRIDEVTGEYAPGKAAVEVVRIEEGFSRARVISASEGNPIIRGDVIANAVYDPNKTYKFVVDGLFDINGDGRATRFERDELAALIERWGGTVVDEVTGDLDFIVLGARPVLPPEPGPGAPIAVINEYNRLQREIQRYNDLLAAAEATSIPLLNANRLQTLIGTFPN
ncbi:MAG: hypothetical protein LAT64_11155 [Phycisphaerales bacterium]|nr:hypothetical protein [Planctomycetota bacterium]MCH8509308.1 hypothetical protein [Phycisphaerales bacterium]